MTVEQARRAVLRAGAAHIPRGDRVALTALELAIADLVETVMSEQINQYRAVIERSNDVLRRVEVAEAQVRELQSWAFATGLLDGVDES